MKFALLFQRPIAVMVIGLLFSCESGFVQIPNIETDIDAVNLYADNGVLCLDSLPYSGYIVSHRGEALTSRVAYYEGRRHGLAMKYFADGSVKEDRNYLRGNKDGVHTGYYPSGQLRFKYTFIDGLSEGTHFEWYEDGSLRAELNYKEGKERGQQRVWRKDGKLRTNYVTRENGRQYGMMGIKRCTKIDSETGDIDPYRGK